MATKISTPAGERESLEAFRRDVIEASMQDLIVLDFWADWCGPCKQLTPVLEKVTGEYAARGVRLVKVDVDKNQTIAAQFRVQSLPTVYAIFQGRPVADLTPARSEAEVRQALDQLLAQLAVGAGAADGEDAEADGFLDAANAALEAGEYAEAARIFGALRSQRPEREDYAAGLVRAMVGEGRLDEADVVLASIPAEGAGAATEQARAALTLARSRVPDDEVAALKAASAAEPDDIEKRFQLASALAANGERDTAADLLLDIIRAAPGWNDDAARSRLLELFEAVGLDDPWVGATRRKLSAILFS